jgi:hypothetical protein
MPRRVRGRVGSRLLCRSAAAMSGALRCRRGALRRGMEDELEAFIAAAGSQSLPWLALAAFEVWRAAPGSKRHGTRTGHTGALVQIGRNAGPAPARRSRPQRCAPSATGSVAGASSSRMPSPSLTGARGTWISSIRPRSRECRARSGNCPASAWRSSSPAGLLAPNAWGRGCFGRRSHGRHQCAPSCRRVGATAGAGPIR